MTDCSFQNHNILHLRLASVSVAAYNIYQYFSFSRILDEIKITEKQPDIPDGGSEAVDIASNKPDASVDEKLPETPDGESRAEAREKNKLNKNIKGSKKLPKIPTGKKHDEM